MNKHEGECGMCVVCKEMAPVGESCCGSGVYFEGGIVRDPEDEDEDETWAPV